MAPFSRLSTSLWKCMFALLALYGTVEVRIFVSLAGEWICA